MSDAQKRGFMGISAAAVVAMVVIAMLLLQRASAGASRVQPIRITLIAHSMSFTLAGSDDMNPILRLPAGAIVEIELINQDPGSVHDLVFPELGFESEPVQPGESLVFRVHIPLGTRQLTYLCSYHPVMMRGSVSIAPAGTAAP